MHLMSLLHFSTTNEQLVPLLHLYINTWCAKILFTLCIFYGKILFHGNGVTVLNIIYFFKRLGNEV